MKKMLAVVLACVLLLIAIPALADNVRTSGDFQYTIKGNGTATIVRYTGPIGDVILPNLIDGYTITSIGDSAFDYSDQYAKSSQGGTITLPNTITSIGEKAFFRFPFTTINLPASLEYIGYGAFAGFEHDFRISNSHPYFAVIDGSLYNKAEKELLYGNSNAIIPEGIVSIGDYAYYAIGQTQIQMPSTVQKIGNYAYAETSYTKTQEIRLPEGLKHIGNYAFLNVYGKVGEKFEFYLPASIQYIGEGAFQCMNRSTLTNGHISPKIFIYFDPNTYLNQVGAYAFATDNKDASINVYMDGTVLEYGDYSFSGASAKSLSNSVEKIGNFAFEGSYFYTTDEILIPSSCRSIGEGAFQEIKHHGVSIIIENGIETISSKAFFGIKTQEPIYLPESLKDIATDAFSKDANFVVEKGSYAERWARDNAFTYTINGEEQNLDWLNN